MSTPTPGYDALNDPNFVPSSTTNPNAPVVQPTPGEEPSEFEGTTADEVPPMEGNMPAEGEPTQTDTSASESTQPETTEQPTEGESTQPEPPADAPPAEDRPVLRPEDVPSNHRVRRVPKPVFVKKKNRLILPHAAGVDYVVDGETVVGVHNVDGPPKVTAQPRADWAFVDGVQTEWDFNE